MRVLHTSDWHIGRTFHGHGLLDDQRRVLDEIAVMVADHQVDAVLVAGDIYDRAIPSAEATQVATRAVTTIRNAGAEIVAISGNHDSAPRLGAFSEVLAHGGFHLRTDPARVAEPVLLGERQVVVYAIPYLEPDIAGGVLGLGGRVGHQAVLDAAMARVRADLAGRPDDTRSMVMAHAFVTGAAPSESERSIAVGGVESVAASTFAGVDYVALGHLHGRQDLSPRCRYSGSPLPYSFGESSQPKGAYLVDIPERGAVRARWLELPTIRPLATLTGTLAELLDGHAELTEHYLSVTLTDAVQPRDAMRRLREQFPYTVTLRWEPGEALTAPVSYPKLGRSMSDEDVIEQFVTQCRGSAPSVDERELIGAAVAGIRVRQVTA